jgi:beta-phosphoglucomutase-like phosphatase (HAD superfamily)
MSRKPNNEKFSGIIFDFNGVLWWDNALQEESWRDFSVWLRGYPLSDLEMAEDVHGRNGRYTLELLAGRSLINKEVEELTEKKEIIYRRMCLEQDDKFCLSPGAESLLDFLIGQHISHTIATASAKPNLDFFMEQLGLARWFDPTLIVYDDGSLAGKPAPDFYLAAASRLQLPPEQCIVIEDSLSGIQAAHAAGIGRVIALVGDGGHLQRVALPPNTAQIRDLTELDRGLFY